MENQDAPSEAPQNENKPILRITAGESSGEVQEDTKTDRPTDEDIIKQHNEIRNEQKETSPLIGTIDPLTLYQQEFEHGNEVFLGKLHLLGEEYSTARRVRRDGNCFFRSFVFSYVESLLRSFNLTERDRMKEHLVQCKEKMISAGFQELVFEDALGILQERINQIGRELTLHEWELVMSDDNLSNYIIMFLRLLTSAEIQLRRDFFEPYIMGISDVLDVELYCRRLVEVMDEESDEIHIRALTDALQIPTRIYALDSRPPIELIPTDYVPESAANKPFLVHLLYRPGHYDIVYPTMK